MGRNFVIFSKRFIEYYSFKSNQTKLYDKRDAFGFHIVNLSLSFMSSNVHKHQPMVSMHLSSFAMTVAVQIIVTFYYATGP